jgi:hypothetical protein
MLTSFPVIKITPAGLQISVKVHAGPALGAKVSNGRSPENQRISYLVALLKFLIQKKLNIRTQINVAAATGYNTDPKIMGD